MRICITGGAGSIGSELARACAARGDAVSVLDISEESLWSLKMELPQVEIHLGDVQSPDDVRPAVRGADVVVHCAAMKHVDLCERSPAIAHRVNVEGTMAVLQALGKTRFVFVSTDKAIQPISVMGRTKAEAEKRCLAHGANVVRFGNVIGTRGSLVPTVIRCRDLSIPIKLTDARMTRFFMSTDEAVALMLQAAEADVRGATFVPAQPQSAIVKHFIECARDVHAPGLEIRTVGARPGERLHEPMDCPAGLRWSNETELLMGREAIFEMLEEAAGVEVQSCTS